jgi:hypothetical protein
MSAIRQQCTTTCSRVSKGAGALPYGQQVTVSRPWGAVLWQLAVLHCLVVQ